MKYDPEYYQKNKNTYKRASKRWTDATRSECPFCKVNVSRVQWLNGTHVKTRIHQTNQSWFTGERGPSPSAKDVEDAISLIQKNSTK